MLPMAGHTLPVRSGLLPSRGAARRYKQAHAVQLFSLEGRADPRVPLAPLRTHQYLGATSALEEVPRPARRPKRATRPK
jgi:hypothetical protein